MSEDFDIMQHFPIPKKMGNEESMLLARIHNLQRDIKIDRGKLYGAINRYFIFKGEPRIHERDKYQVALRALEEISKFGKRNAGYGYTCHRISQNAIDELTRED